MTEAQLILPKDAGESKSSADRLRGSISVDNRTFWTETELVKAAEFVRKVPRLGQTRGVEVRFIAKREARIKNTELARRLGCDEKEVRRMLDPRHPTKLPRIQAALEALGKRLVVSMEEEAA